MYLTHLVADVHQSMHAGNAKDRGGNNIGFENRGEKTNLHALWDYGLLVRKGKSFLQYACQLNCRQKDDDIFDINSILFKSWTNESRNAALNWAYPVLYNDWREPDPKYIKESRRVFNNQMCRSGMRLAYLFNQIFTNGEKVPSQMR